MRVPLDLDDILDDADDKALPQWKRVGGFEVLESPLGTAILAPGQWDAHALLRYPDRVHIDLGRGQIDTMKQTCERALRERPVRMQTLEIEDDPVVVETHVEVAPPPPRKTLEKPPPRIWTTIPISQGADDYEEVVERGFDRHR